MQIYQKDSDNPVFYVRLVDQFGVPVAGVTSPTVTLSKSQAADGTTVTWVEDTDFTWHELTDNEKLKGVYKLRQKDSPNVSAVDTVGQCVLDVYKTDAATAHGVAAYQVNTLLTDVHLTRAALVNQRQHTIDTGVDVIKDDDGTTTLVTLTPSEDEGVITVTPS